MKRSRDGLLLVVLMATCLLATPSLAAEQVSVRYGLFEQSLPVVDLR